MTKHAKSGIIIFLTAIFIINSVFSYTQQSYIFVLGELGNRLGLIYKYDDIEISGELALDLKNNTLMFVSCESNYYLYDISNMRRRDRNCSNELGVWPDDLFSSIKPTLGNKIVLSGPPQTCGICTDIPFEDFILPENVIINSTIPIEDPSYEELLNEYKIKITPVETQKFTEPNFDDIYLPPNIGTYSP